MSQPKTFEVTAKQDESEAYVVKAGPGCVWLSIAWAAAALIAAVAFLLKVLR